MYNNIMENLCIAHWQRYNQKNKKENQTQPITPYTNTIFKRDRTLDAHPALRTGGRLKHARTHKYHYSI